MNINDIDEAVEQVKSWNRYGQSNDLVTKVLVSAVVALFVLWLLSVFINPVPTFN